MNKNILKIIGVTAIVAGAVCLFVTGVNADAVTAIVGAVFVLAGLVAAIFSVKK
jgi:uncharacterized membrane protein HdeD (DUF308 family)